MKLRLLVFASLITFSLFAQTLTPKQELTIRSLMVKYFGERINVEPLYTGIHSFVYIKNDTFYTPDGFHYIFKLKNDTALRLDNTFYHGSNFRRFLFTRGSSIYQLGGYGFYQTNNNLEVFDLQTNKWRLEKTSGEKPPYINGVVIEKGDVLYSFYNFKSGNNVEPDVFDNNIYKLDLGTNTWTRFSNLNLPNDRAVRSYYTPSFALVIKYNEAMVINKRSLKYIILGRDVFHSSHHEYNYEVNGDSIKFGSSEKFISLQEVWNKHTNIAVDFILEPTWFQTLYTSTYLTLVGLILLISFLVYFIKRKNVKTKEPGKNETELHLNPLVEKIEASIKNTLDIDELDALLEINHMEFDSRKLKRHRLLSDLEKTNPGLITRQKDDTDKRRFIYVIQKS